MTPRLAAHATVHDYPGGSLALGPMMGVSASFLRAAVNPQDLTHSLTIERASRLISITGDARILAAIAEENGYTIVKLPSIVISDSALLESYTSLNSELGDFAHVFNKSLADSKISKKEFNQMREEWYQAVSVGFTLLSRIEQLAE